MDGLSDGGEVMKRGRSILFNNIRDTQQFEHFLAIAAAAAIVVIVTATMFLFYDPKKGKT